jgi:hypothetical protein
MITYGLHPQVEDNYRSFLTARAVSGQAVIALQSVSELAVNDLLCIGIQEQELTEIKKILSISGKNVTLSANLDNTHAENTKVFVIKYDKIKFMKASSINGTYSVVATKDIAISEKHTIYEDSAAISTEYFKVFHYNSITGDSSPVSDPIGQAGYDRTTLASMVDSTYKKFGDKDRTFLERDEIIAWCNDAKDILVNAIAETNEKYFNTRTTIAMEADGEQVLPDDFKKEQKVQFSFSGSESGAVRASKIEIEDIDDSQTYSQGNPVWYFNNFSIGARPKGTSSGVIYLDYEAHPIDLLDDADTLPKPIDKYRSLVLDYMLAMAFEKAKKFNISAVILKRFTDGKEEMIEHINNLSLDQNRTVKDNGW